MSDNPYSYEIKARQGSRNVFELLSIVQRLAVIAESQLDGERDTNLVHEQEIKKLQTRLRQDDLGTEYLRQENRTLREEKKERERAIDLIILDLSDAYADREEDADALASGVKSALRLLKSLRPTTDIPF